MSDYCVTCDGTHYMLGWEYPCPDCRPRVRAANEAVEVILRSRRVTHPAEMADLITGVLAGLALVGEEATRGLPDPYVVKRLADLDWRRP